CWGCCGWAGKPPDGVPGYPPWGCWPHCCGSLPPDGPYGLVIVASVLWSTPISGRLAASNHSPAPPRGRPGQSVSPRTLPPSVRAGIRQSEGAHRHHATPQRLDRLGGRRAHRLAPADHVPELVEQVDHLPAPAHEVAGRHLLAVGLGGSQHLLQG